MTTRLFLLALVGFMILTTTLVQTAQAQLVFGPVGVQYNGYGQGYYGGYGQGYGYNGRVYRPRVDSYTVYGNGPYGYGSGSQFQFPVNGNTGFYGNGNSGSYGFGNSGYYQQGYTRTYNPYGYSYYGY